MCWTRWLQQWTSRSLIAMQRSHIAHVSNDVRCWRRWIVVVQGDEQLSEDGRDRLRRHSPAFSAKRIWNRRAVLKCHWYFVWLPSLNYIVHDFIRVFDSFHTGRWFLCASHPAFADELFEHEVSLRQKAPCAVTLWKIEFWPCIFLLINFILGSIIEF